MSNDLKTFELPGLGLLDSSLLKTVQIVDTDSGAPLYGVHVYVNGKAVGNTNEAGNVTIIAQSPNDKITFSHVSHDLKTFTFQNMGSYINLDAKALTQSPVLVVGTTDSKTNWIKWAGVGIAALVLIAMLNQNKPKKITV